MIWPQRQTQRQPLQSRSVSGAFAMQPLEDEDVEDEDLENDAFSSDNEDEQGRPQVKQQQKPAIAAKSPGGTSGSAQVSSLQLSSRAAVAPRPAAPDTAQGTGDGCAGPPRWKDQIEDDPFFASAGPDASDEDTAKTAIVKGPGASAWQSAVREVSTMSCNAALQSHAQCHTPAKLSGPPSLMCAGQAPAGSAEQGQAAAAAAEQQTHEPVSTWEASPSRPGPLSAWPRQRQPRQAPSGIQEQASEACANLGQAAQVI